MQIRPFLCVCAHASVCKSIVGGQTGYSTTVSQMPEGAETFSICNKEPGGVEIKVVPLPFNDSDDCTHRLQYASSHSGTKFNVWMEIGKLFAHLHHLLSISSDGERQTMIKKSSPLAKLGRKQFKTNKNINWSLSFLWGMPVNCSTTQLKEVMLLLRS